MVTPLKSELDLAAAKEIAEAAIAPEAFDFAAAVLDRDYPEITVPVYLNEKLAMRLVNIIREREELMERIAKAHKNNPSAPDWAERLAELDTDFEETAKSLRAEEYKVLIKGIAPEEQVEMERLAFEKFPKEYIESAHPLTGSVVKTEVPSDERDEYHAMLIRRANLVSVTAPNGAVDDQFEDLEKVIATFHRLPLVARVKIDEAIGNSTIAVDYYRELVDEVF